MASPAVVAYYEGLSSSLKISALPNPADRFNMRRMIGEGTYGEVSVLHSLTNMTMA